MLKVNVACALSWGVTSIGFTLLGVAHPIREKHFRCGTCVGGRLSSGATRVKKIDLWLYDYFGKIFWSKLILACTNVLMSSN